MHKSQVKRKNRTQPKKKITITKKTTSKKKPATKKPLVKKPHQMTFAELKRKCAKYQSRLLESVQKIFEADGLNYRNGELTSYVVYLFLYDCLYNQTTNPFFHKLYEHLEHNPDDREKLKIQIQSEYFEEPFVHMNRKKLISVGEDYIKDGAGGRYSSELEKIKRNFLEDTYE